MKKNFQTVSIAALILMMTVSLAVAGTVIELKTKSVKTGDSDAIVYLEKNKLRIDSNERGKQYSVIYLVGEGADVTYWIIDHADESYYEITPEDMKKMQSQVEESMKAVHKRMDSMPPSKRKEVEKSYNQQLVLMGRGEQMYLYETVGKGTKAGSWVCTQYAGKIGEDKLEDVWVATWDELSAPKQDFTVVTHMAEMFSAVGQRMPAFFQFGRIRGDEGFPIMVVSYENGTESERSEVQSVKQEKFGDKVFALPAGLTMKKPTAPPNRM